MPVCFEYATLTLSKDIPQNKDHKAFYVELVL